MSEVGVTAAAAVSSSGAAKPIRRVFYASAAGDVIAAHRAWLRGVPNASQIRETESGQIQDFCRAVGAEGYVVASAGPAEVLRDAPFTVERRPKPNGECRGLHWHIREARHGLGLLRTAREFGADLLIVDTGAIPYYLLTAARTRGMRVVAVLHNTFFPGGRRPRSAGRRAVLHLDVLRFWRSVPTATLGVSPTCVRQLRELAGHRLCGRVAEFRLMFRREYFDEIPPPPPHEHSPFRVHFVGRATVSKGALDVLTMARIAEDRLPGRIRWEVCGDGPDLLRMREAQHRLRLGSVVALRGWTSPADLAVVHAHSHVGVVPTRSCFPEGMASTAVECVLAGRPVVTNRNVPALEVLRPACLEARPDDPESHATQIVRLATDPALYATLRLACADLQPQFYDRELGLAATLLRTLSERPDVA